MNNHGSISPSSWKDKIISFFNYFKYKKQTFNYKCPICLDVVADNSLFSLKCGHCFCWECIKIYSTNYNKIAIKCFLCRQYSFGCCLDTTFHKLKMLHSCKWLLLNKKLYQINCGHIYCVHFYISTSTVFCMICFKLSEIYPLFLWF